MTYRVISKSRPPVSTSRCDPNDSTIPYRTCPASVKSGRLLHQHVREITRRRNEEESTLDLIFTKEEEDVKNIKVLPPLGDSDHDIVVADYVSEWISKVEYKPRRMYHKGNYDCIIEELGRINWELEFENKTVHECWEIFKIKLKALIEEYIPMTKHKDYNEPWMNGKLMRRRKRKYFAWEKFHRKRKLPKV